MLMFHALLSPSLPTVHRRIYSRLVQPHHLSVEQTARPRAYPQRVEARAVRYEHREAPAKSVERPDGTRSYLSDCVLAPGPDSCSATRSCKGCNDLFDPQDGNASVGERSLA